LIYERTTLCQLGLSLEFLEHDCTSIQQGLPWALPSRPRQWLFFGWQQSFFRRPDLHVTAASDWDASFAVERVNL
jgi:hypothetical protein